MTSRASRPDIPFVLAFLLLDMADRCGVAFETLHATVKPGETRVAIKDKCIDGVFVELGDFRDFAVADGNGEVHAQWGTPPTPTPDQ
jgi:hypothetical protein